MAGSPLGVLASQSLLNFVVDKAAVRQLAFAEGRNRSRRGNKDSREGGGEWQVAHAAQRGGRRDEGNARKRRPRAWIMQGFFSSVVSAVGGVFADENDREIPPAAVSLSDIEFAEVSARSACAPRSMCVCLQLCSLRFVLRNLREDQ